MRSRRLLVLVLAVVAVLAALAPVAASAEVTPAATQVTPLLSFGEPGKGAGQLHNPTGGEFAASGDYYVVDQRNRRIDVFSPSGSFRFTFGKEVNEGDGSDLCEAGGECGLGGNGPGAGELAVPEDLALLGGRVYVTEADNNRVSVFTEAGAFLFAFGRDVNLETGGLKCEAASGCKAALAGGNEGEFNEPSGVAADGGRLYVADKRNNRVDVYDANGSFSEAFGKEVTVGGGDVCAGHVACQAGEEGSGAGYLARPIAIAVGGGKIYLSSDPNNRIDVVGTNGTFVRAFGRGVAPGGADVCTAISGCARGAEGFEPAAVPNAYGIVVGTEGDVFVADERANRVSRFDQSGNFLLAWGEGVLNGAGALEVCTTVCLQGKGGTGEGAVNGPHGLALNAEGQIAVTETEGELSEEVSRITLFREYEIGQVTVTVEIPPAPKQGPLPMPLPAPAPPANRFKFGRLTLNPKKGTATLAVTVTDPGKLVLSGKGVKKVTKAPWKAGTVKLTVALVGAVKKKLAEDGSVKVRAKITFTPTGGTSRTQAKPLSLRLKLP